MDSSNRDPKQERPPLCYRHVDMARTQYIVLPTPLVLMGLSPNAFRLIVYIASRPPDWKLRPEQAAKACGFGTSAFYNAQNELEAAGLARHIGEREGGRFVRRYWQFTVTPGVFPAEVDERLLVKSTKRRRKPVGGLPEEVSPEEVRRRLTYTGQSQSKDNTKKRKSGLEAIAPATKGADLGFLNGGLIVTDTARSKGAASPATTAPALSKMGSAMESLPDRWPFPDDADVTRRVRSRGIEPEAVWKQFRAKLAAGKIPRVPDNPAGYMVGIAKGMAKEAFGPADPGALARAREALMSRRNGVKP